MVLLSAQAADLIAASGKKWGHLGVTRNDADSVYNVVSWSTGPNGIKRPLQEGWRGHDSATWMKGADGDVLWYRGSADLHKRGRGDAIRGQATPVDFLKEQVEGDWLNFKRAILVVTFYVRDGQTEWAAWMREGENVFRPVDLEIFDPDADLLAPLDIGWPRQAIAEEKVTVIGLGSIGAAACEAMAAYGLRNFALVDPDRLESHNFARHRSTRRHHGKYKVDSVAELMQERDSSVAIERVIADVGRDANQMRGLFSESSLIACFTDGPASRRMTSHLAFSAGRPVVLACILDLGAYGEVLRLLPGRTGCLQCNRDGLSERLELGVELAEYQERLQVSRQGGHVGLSRGFGHYGVDVGELPTTAVTGDLHLVGAFAAKTVVATLLSRAGHREQRLPGSHALLGLRPPMIPDAAPFDRVAHPGTVAWLPTSAPDLDCPTCGPDARR